MSIKYSLSKIGADTAENGQHGRNYWHTSAMKIRSRLGRRDPGRGAGCRLVRRGGQLGVRLGHPALRAEDRPLRARGGAPGGGGLGRRRRRGGGPPRCPLARWLRSAKPYRLVKILLDDIVDLEEHAY